MQFPKLMSSNVMFWPANSPQPKDFTIIDNYGNQQILTFEKLEPDYFGMTQNY